jgi:hypothetical protein
MLGSQRIRLRRKLRSTGEEEVGQEAGRSRCHGESVAEMAAIEM